MPTLILPLESPPREQAPQKDTVCVRHSGGLAPNTCGGRRREHISRHQATSEDLLP